MASGRAVSAAGKLEGFECFLKYLPTDTTEDGLQTFFADAGEIVGTARLLKHPQTGKCKGVGWLTFATEEGLKEALKWDGCAYGGRHLSVTAAKQQHTGIRPTLQAPGTHTPALLHEVLGSMVAREKSGVYVDATFGRGGHSRAILGALSPEGRLHAFDMDPEAIAAGEALARADPRFVIHHAPFGDMERVLAPLSVTPTAVFFDLGISSPQFDEAHRGFRPEADGPLDLRFDQTRGETALQFLQRAPREEIARVIHEYGETSDAAASRRIADAICLVRAQGGSGRGGGGGLPTRTREFAALVAAAKGKEYQAMHPAKLTFQALRIHLNDEYGQMKRGLAAAFALVGDGGRIGLISWKHSECAIIVDFYRTLEAARDECPLRGWYNARVQQAAREGTPPPPTLPVDSWSLAMDDARRPTDAELQTNSRSRSAVLHVLRKRRAPRLAHLEAIAYPMLGWGDSGAPTLCPTADEASSAPAEAGDDKERRKQRKAERRAAAAAAAAIGQGGEESPESDTAQKSAAAARNREAKKALKRQRREEESAAKAATTKDGDAATLTDGGRAKKRRSA